MPLIKPDIQRALRSAGIDNTTGDESLSELMDKKDMSLSQILDDLSDFIKTSTNEPLRMRAIEMALKMKGALKEQAATALPTININIQDSQANVTSDINPILVPRAQKAAN